MAVSTEAMVVDSDVKPAKEAVSEASGKDAKELKEKMEQLPVPLPMLKETFPDSLSKEYLLTADKNGHTPLYRAIAQNDLISVKRLLTSFGPEQLARFEWLCTINATEGTRDWVYCKSWMQRFDKQTKEMYDFLETAFKQAMLAAFTFSSRFRPLEIFMARTQAGWNDLMIAVMDGDEHSMEWIFEHSPQQIMAVDKQGYNALMHAIGERRVHAGYKILGKGCSSQQVLQQDTGLGYNALSLAVVTLNSSVHFVDKLLNSVDNNTKKQMMMQKGYKDKTALMLSCEMPNEEVAERLALEVDREILLAKDENGCFALFHAIWYGRLAAVQALLKWFPQDQLLPIENDLGQPVWSYAEELSRRNELHFSNSPEDVGITVTAQKRDAYLKIATVIKQKYDELGLGKVIKSAVPKTLPKGSDLKGSHSDPTSLSSRKLVAQKRKRSSGRFVAQNADTTATVGSNPLNFPAQEKAQAVQATIPKEQEKPCSALKINIPEIPLAAIELQPSPSLHSAAASGIPQAAEPVVNAAQPVEVLKAEGLAPQVSLDAIRQSGAVSAVPAVPVLPAMPIAPLVPAAVINLPAQVLDLRPEEDTVSQPALLFSQKKPVTQYKGGLRRKEPAIIPDENAIQNQMLYNPVKSSESRSSFQPPDSRLSAPQSLPQDHQTARQGIKRNRADRDDSSLIAPAGAGAGAELNSGSSVMPSMEVGVAAMEIDEIGAAAVTAEAPAAKRQKIQ